MKLMSSFLFALFFAMSVIACKDMGDTGDQAGTAADTTDRESDLKLRERDFVDDVIEANNEEIAWLYAAVKSGTDTGLKNDAQRMLADHEKMDADLKALARNKNVAIEDGDTTTIILDINEDNGNEWDEEWADEMADKHRRLIRRFERAEGYAEDADLKSVISSALPTLRSHLDMTTRLEERLDRK